MVCSEMWVFFFFQAEDGIRDLTVTGVQTCALPISLEPAHGSQAHVEIQHLSQRHVERADAAADRSGQRSLDGDEIRPARLDGLVRQPGAEELVGLLSRVYLHPVNAPPAAVGLGHGGVHDAHAGAPDVGARAVTLDERNDRVLRDDQLAVADGDPGALRGRGDPGGGCRGHELHLRKRVAGCTDLAGGANASTPPTPSRPRTWAPSRMRDWRGRARGWKRRG